MDLLLTIILLLAIWFVIALIGGIFIGKAMKWSWRKLDN